MKRLLVILGLLFVAGVAIAGVLYVTFPVQMTTYGGMGLNFLKSLFAPAGTLTIETNPAYKAPVAAVPSPPLADAAWPNAAVGDWPSYNRTPSSQRFSPLDQINTKNVGNLKVLCTYDARVITAFESGLIMVNNALIGTTEFDIFSHQPGHVRRELAHAPGLSRRAFCPPTAAPPTWTACCFAAHRTVGCWPSISRPANKCGRRRSATRNVASRCRRRRSPRTASSTSAMPAETSRAARARCTRSRQRPARSSGSSFSSPKSKATWSGPAGQVAARHVDLEQRARHTHQRRRHLDLVHARYQERLAVRPGRQSGPRLRLGSTRRRESLHRLGRRTRRQDGRLQEPLQGREKGLA